jgi:hypothetical protein
MATPGAPSMSVPHDPLPPGGTFSAETGLRLCRRSTPHPITHPYRRFANDENLIVSPPRAYYRRSLPLVQRAGKDSRTAVLIG